jgi:L-ascorbate metabolism protein UlaG (beta-lactamase superfamily)
MSTSEEASITFHGSTFLELNFQQTSLFIDPVFSTTRRGRRLRGATRPCDYVFVTHPGDGFDDVLDLLDESKEAILVGAERTCRIAQAELGLGRKRLLDLEPWERASETAFRVTAVPTARPSMVEESVAILEDLGGAGLGRLMPRGAARVPGVSAGMRALESLPFLGNELMKNLRGRPGLGFLFEMTAGQRVLHLADGVHGASDERELEDIASLSPIDALLLDVGSQGVDSVVRAVRQFDVATVLFYRSQDPYARGRRAQALPVNAFIEAVQEDQADVEALHLREGDRYILGASKKSEAARPAAASTSATSAAPASKPVDATKPAAKA